MFLKSMISQNKELLDAAFTLHQQGLLKPDSYLVDLDRFTENAKRIRLEADRHNIKLYFMLKQLGRNPYLAKRLTELGYDGAVAVDFKEASLMMQHNIPLGNVGHLVQIPEQMIAPVVEYGAEVITVYSSEIIQSIDKAAKKAGKIQKILIRVNDEKDKIYSGQTAGFMLSELKERAKEIIACSNVKIAGVTSFPCYLFNEEKQEIEPTENLRTVMKAVKLLRELGIEPEIINTPSSTCVKTLKLMKEDGGNCGEPGHGLTGTTPEHSVHPMEEVPAVVYVSEISHNFMGRGYCYGGGHYRRSHMEHGLVGRCRDTASLMKVTPPSHESIDYHFELEEEAVVGETVIMAFRFQIFVTRSDVVLVKGISRNKPEIVGIYDSLGNIKWEKDLL